MYLIHVLTTCLGVSGVSTSSTLIMCVSENQLVMSIYKAACSAVVCVDSDAHITLKMCDLSAHAYRTRYVDMLSTCIGCLFGCSIGRLAYRMRFS